MKNKKYGKHSDVMIDLETLGTDPDCIVLSIGAVHFDLESGKLGNTFEAVLDKKQQKEKGRTTTKSTLQWWRKQSDEAKKVLTHPGIDVKEALEIFTKFLKQKTYITVWGNGASFDVSIMEDLYRDFDLKIPWQFWNVMDQRTFKRFVAGGEKLVVEEGVAHNALDDAKAQAQYVINHIQTNEAREKEIEEMRHRLEGLDK